MGEEMEEKKVEMIYHVLFLLANNVNYSTQTKTIYCCESPSQSL